MINHNTIGYMMHPICIFETNVFVPIEYFLLEDKWVKIYAESRMEDIIIKKN